MRTLYCISLTDSRMIIILSSKIVGLSLRTFNGECRLWKIDYHWCPGVREWTLETQIYTKINLKELKILQLYTYITHSRGGRWVLVCVIKNFFILHLFLVHFVYSIGSGQLDVVSKLCFTQMCPVQNDDLVSSPFFKSRVL